VARIAPRLKTNTIDHVLKARLNKTKKASGMVRALLSELIPILWKRVILGLKID
jgi:hypothetical protein